MSFIPYGMQWITEDDIEEVSKILRGGWITTGPNVESFEHDVASYVGAKHAVAVNSGTSALDIAVAALEIERGAEVITTPFTFVATANSAIYNGLKPVFADIDPKTYNIDPDDIRKKITNKTKIITYVDYAGQPCDINEIREIAQENNIRLIEDACHALGAEYRGKKIGSFADMTVFSFHPVKHITTGEGGMVTTENDELYPKLRMLRNHGIDKGAAERFGPNASWAYDMKVLGRNYRITDFQCALGRSQLKRVDDFIRRRNEIAKLYGEKFAGLSGITVPYVKPDVKHAWHLYTILLDRGLDRDKFFSQMKQRGIGVNLHYIPSYRFTYYRKNFDFKEKDYPVTEDVFSRIITLPMFPKMTDQDISTVVDAVKDSLKAL